MTSAYFVADDFRRCRNRVVIPFCPRHRGVDGERQVLRGRRQNEAAAQKRRKKRRIQTRKHGEEATKYRETAAGRPLENRFQYTKPPRQVK
jgi:hypothetical protein